MAGIVTDIIRTAFLPGEHEDYQVSTMIHVILIQRLNFRSWD